MSTKSTVGDFLRKIDELEAQAMALKEHRDLLNEEAKKQAEKRDALNLEHKKLREEIAHYKSERDQANQKVSEFKKERLDLKTELDAKRQQYSQTQDRVKGLLSKTSMSKGETERQIKALDWKIQTNSLSKAEEDSIINQIKLLEQQNLIQKEASSLKDKAVTSKAEFVALQIRNNDIKDKMAEHVAQGQEYHKKMLEKIKEAEETKDRADKAHQEFVRLREEADAEHEKYSEFIKQINAVNLEIRMLEENTRKRREDAVIDAQADTAYKKMKEKKKLTFEEFQALVKRGRI